MVEKKKILKNWTTRGEKKWRVEQILSLTGKMSGKRGSCSKGKKDLYGRKKDSENAHLILPKKGVKHPVQKGTCLGHLCRMKFPNAKDGEGKMSGGGIFKSVLPARD